MKKSGILNRDLMTQLTGLGHTDCFLLCDAGFPVPNDAIRIDLALVMGLPSFMDCLEAILSEIVVEEITVAEEMRQNNPETFGAVIALFKNQTKNIVPQTQFVTASKKTKFIVRTADMKPYSNILLQAASGVEEYKKNLII